MRDVQVLSTCTSLMPTVGEGYIQTVEAYNETGELVFVYCLYTSSLLQRLMYNGGPSYWEASVEALANGSLLIHNFRAFFSGEYTCVAENPKGMAAVSITVSTKIHS